MRLVVFVGMAVLLFSLCLLFAQQDEQCKGQRSEPNGTEETEWEQWEQAWLELNEWQETIEDEIKLRAKYSKILDLWDAFTKPWLISGSKTRTYIWTPKDVYLVGEPVPIYVETVAKKDSMLSRTQKATSP